MAPSHTASQQLKAHLWVRLRVQRKTELKKYESRQYLTASEVLRPWHQKIKKIKHRDPDRATLFSVARRLLDEHRRLILSGADRDAFLAAIRRRPDPSPRLVNALKRHRDLFG